MSACARTSSGKDIGGYIELQDALRENGATIEAVSTIDQPFFSVEGQVITVNGTRVQVYEYPSEGARQADSSEISTDGATIGMTMVTWLDRPTFWAKGRLIVLYLGTDQATVDLVSAVMDEPIAQGDTSATEPPDAVTAGQRVLGEALTVPASQIALVQYERIEWPDACLGLPDPEEACVQVVTPGWRAVATVNGQRYEIRTDESGQLIRWQQLDAASTS
jgi:hypothetical protein